MSELDVMKMLMEESRGEHHWTCQTPGLNPDDLTLLHTALVSPQLHRNIFPVLIQEDTNQELPVFGPKIISEFTESGVCITNTGSRKITNYVVLFCSDI